MNSLERTLAALSHQEADRVPLFLLLTMHGARELQIPIREYFQKPEYVARGQLAMQKKYGNDCLYAFQYAPLEVEAFGGEVLFVENGPPNTGEPILRTFEQIDHLELPLIEEVPCMRRVLDAIMMMKEGVGNEVPIIGVVMSPFSLPVMQLGFEKYLELLYDRPEAFMKLMRFNEAFCTAWANAQLAAGATAICYFDPLASPNMIEREKYLETGYLIAKRVISSIRGPVATHLASGISLPVMNEIAGTGSVAIGFGSEEDLHQMKATTRGRICLLGNLNGLEMIHWDAEQARREVRRLIDHTAEGGGLIISDNHGEIPWQVSEEVLLAVAEAVRSEGTYPLQGH